jgi:hypothetical protein
MAMHDIHAHLRFLSISAQKVRLVVDMVRGRDANEALELLRFETKAPAMTVRKLLASAVANAEETSASAGTICMWPRFLPMRRRLASGDALGRAAASSLFCAALRM